MLKSPKHFFVSYVTECDVGCEKRKTLAGRWSASLRQPVCSSTQQIPPNVRLREPCNDNGGSSHDDYDNTATNTFSIAVASEPTRARSDSIALAGKHSNLLCF